MDHYLDITLRPDPEFVPAHLMNALFAKLHRALVSARCEDVGISFPQVHGKGLGLVLRLHGQQARLSDLMAKPWLAGMRDHVDVHTVQAVPATGVGYRVVSRVQAKSSPARERRRLMRRQGLDTDQARQRIPDSSAECLSLPYVQLNSCSTAQQFKLFIQHGPLRSTSTPGSFSAYGLSPQATVPWF